MNTNIVIRWAYWKVTDKDHVRILIHLADDNNLCENETLEAMIEDEAACRALVRIQELAKLGWWLQNELREAEIRREDGEDIHWCRACRIWAWGFGEQSDPCTPYDEPKINPTIGIRVHKKDRDLWIARAHDFAAGVIADSIDPQSQARRYLDGMRAANEREWDADQLQQQDHNNGMDRTVAAHGTLPAGNTPTPAYYHPDETEAEPDQAELQRRRAETNARGRALVTAVLQQRTEPDWDNLPIPIPALPTDFEKATA